MKTSLGKRILCLLLTVLLVVTCAPASYAQSEEEDKGPLSVSMEVYTNLEGIHTVSGIYYDGGFYLSPSELATMTGATLNAESDKSAVLGMYTGAQPFKVGEGGIPQIPYITVEDSLYVSAPHFLRYFGCTVTFAPDETSAVSMIVYVPYTIVDALGEYADNDYVSFSWGEADGVGSLTRVLSALDTAILSYDSNLLTYALTPDEVSEDIYMDVLKVILSDSGAESLDQQDYALSVFNSMNDDIGELSTSFSVMDYLSSAMGSNAMDNIGVLNDTLGINIFDAAGFALDVTTDQMAEMEMFKQFYNMGTVQKDLFGRTLGSVTMRNPVYWQDTELFEAAEKVQQMMDGTYSTNVLEEAFNEGIETGVSIALGQSKYAAPMLAWDLLVSLAENIAPEPFLDKEQHVTLAGGCSNVVSISWNMLCSAVDEVSAGLPYNDPGLYFAERDAQYDLALHLKASMAARNLLLDTGWVKEPAATEMQLRNAYAAKLLNRVMNAEVVLPGSPFMVEEDLTWIRLLAKSGGVLGQTVELGQDVFYWKYNADCFEKRGTRSYLGQRTQTIPLVRRSPDGKETVLFEDKGTGSIAVTQNYIFYQRNGNYKDGSIGTDIIAWDRRTETATNLGRGAMIDISEDGRYLICQEDTKFYKQLDVQNLTWSVFADGFNYFILWDGVFYSMLPVEDREAAQKGQVCIGYMPVGETEMKVLCTTEPDLYKFTSGFSAASIGQMIFTEDYIYFSYGSIAGTGLMYQGGKVMRVGYDGSNPTVVAGEDQLVGPDFVVNEDGSVSQDPDMGVNVAYFSSMNDLTIRDGGAYMLDRTSGRVEKILDEKDYASIGTDTVQIRGVERSEDHIFYFVHGIEANGIMISEEYERIKSALYMKDLKTGTVTELYSF